MGRQCNECDSRSHATGECPEAAATAQRLGLAAPAAVFVPDEPPSKRAYSCGVCGLLGHTAKRCRNALLPVPRDLFALVEAEAARVAARTGKTITTEQLAAQLLKAAVG